jgi:ribosomal-protein-alanine N-acetyltransferase
MICVDADVIMLRYRAQELIYHRCESVLGRPVGGFNVESVRIRRLADRREAEGCAGMMAASEPWTTLGRGYEEQLRIIADPSREVYVAVAEGEVVGLVVIEMNGSFKGYVKSICVSPGLRGRGVGAALMTYAEDRIFRETPNVFLCVSDFNVGAQRFYTRLGYEAVGELRDYVVEGHSETLMRKTVGPLVGR